MPTSRNPKGRIEEIEQAKLVRWSHLTTVRALMPALAFLHHSPNGGQRSSFTGAQMKALGTKPGFPDLILPARTDHATGLAIEMKRPDGGRVSPEQNTWLNFLEDNGWTTAVCKSAQEARVIICDYLSVSSNVAPPIE